MKKYLQRAALASIAITALLNSSCKKNAEFGSMNSGNFTDTTGSIKSSAANIFANFGMAVTYGNMSNNAAYRATVKREANVVTFGNELKEGSVVKNDGTYDYTTADALYNLCATNGLAVYGHTLVWYQQQNATYLNSLIQALVVPGSGGTPAPNLLAGLNGDFESGTGNSFTGWNNLAGGSSSATFTAVAGNNSTRAMQVNVVTPGANAYDVQSIGPQYTVTGGHTINFSVDIKSTNTSGKVRVVIQNSGYQQYDINTTGAGWTTYTFSLTANETTPIIRFNFPVAGTYTIDNLTIVDPSQAVPATGAVQPTKAQVAAVIDPEMKRYIQTTLAHYAGKINAWDVVNEPLLDNGQIRTNTNYTIPTSSSSSQFLYGQYLGVNRTGDNYILRAFKYARQAAPNATLFINDYNLEYAKVKTDSMVALVKNLNTNGATVDGIGTQLHVNLGTNLANIDYMFQQLASTGLKVRISELDVAINGSKSSPFTPDAMLLGYQAQMYKYIIASYIKNVPAPQRYGVTVWGVADSDSWLNTTASPDAPLLFDKNYKKKPAYAGFVQALKGQ